MGLIDLLITAYDDAEDFASNVALEDSNGLQLRVSGSDAFRKVVLGTRIKPPSGNGFDVDRAIGRLIAPSVQSMSNCFVDTDRSKVA